MVSWAVKYTSGTAAASVKLQPSGIGMAMRAVVRRLYDQEGILRYGAKFVPVAG